MYVNYPGTVRISRHPTNRESSFYRSIDSDVSELGGSEATPRTSGGCAGDKPEVEASSDDSFEESVRTHFELVLSRVSAAREIVGVYRDFLELYKCAEDLMVLRPEIKSIFAYLHGHTSVPPNLAEHSYEYDRQVEFCEQVLRPATEDLEGRLNAWEEYSATKYPYAEVS